MRTLCALEHMRAWMRTLRYDKFLGEVLPLDQLKLSFSDIWREHSSFTIVNMPNSFFYIKC